LRKPNFKQYIIGSVSPPPLHLSLLYPGTWKGEVIKAIMMHGRPLEWRELQNATGLEEKSLNRALYELIDSEEIHKVDKKYDLSKKLYTDYDKFFNLRKTELTSWIGQWKKVRKLDFSLEHEHFFLEGRHLDDFSKELISHAKSEVLVVNPFIQDCDLSNTLREVKKKGIEVQIITRSPHDDKYPEYLKRKQEYHAKLKQDGIALIYKEKVHAKLLVVDRAVAIASSMNFYPGSSAGVSWEAGLVSTDSKVVESVVQSTLSRLT
jgi:predicted transcriptional regulator